MNGFLYLCFPFLFGNICRCPTQEKEGEPLSLSQSFVAAAAAVVVSIGIILELSCLP